MLKFTSMNFMAKTSVGEPLTINGRAVEEEARCGDGVAEVGAVGVGGSVAGSAASVNEAIGGRVVWLLARA